MIKTAPTVHQQTARADEKYTGTHQYRDPMNRNATHTSTDHPKGNNLKGCAMHSTQPSVSSLPPCPLLRRPFHPVIASKAKQSLNIAATDKANRSIIVSTSVITSTSVIASPSSRHRPPLSLSLRAKRSKPKTQKFIATPLPNLTTKKQKT